MTVFILTVYYWQTFPIPRSTNPDRLGEKPPDFRRQNPLLELLLTPSSRVCGENGSLPTGLLLFMNVVQPKPIAICSHI